MKKFYTILLALVCSLTMLQAQAWWSYDGSANPLHDATLGFDASSAGTVGDSTVEKDKLITGNYVFKYYNPGTASATDKLFYRQKYSNAFNKGYTLVARIKGDKDAAYNSIGDYDFDFGQFGTGLRVNFRINPSTGELSWEKGTGSAATISEDLSDWHIYRFTIGGDGAVNLYFDEDATPIATGTCEAHTTTNNYFRFGDGGSAIVGSYTDYILVDTTGAYAPAASAIPAGFSTDFGPTQVGSGINVAVISEKSIVDSNGYYADSMFVVDLKTAGFTVTETGVSGGLTPEAKVIVEAADVVLITRTPGSSDLGGDKDYWAALQVPILSMSTFGSEAKRMGWLPSNTAIYGSKFSDFPAKVEMSDTAFYNITVPGADSTIVFAHTQLSLVTITPEDLAKINGDVLLSVTNGPAAKNCKTGLPGVDVDFSQNNGTPLMIRWAAGDTMFSGQFSTFSSVRAMHYRTYISGGDDHDQYIKYDVTPVDTVVSKETYVYSDDMNQVIQDELIYLSSLEGLSQSNNFDLKSLTTSVGTIDPDSVNGVYLYSVVVPDGTNGDVTITVVADDANATIAPNADGRFVVAFDGTPVTLPFTVTSEAGTEKSYSVSIKEKVEVVGKVIPPGTSNISIFLADAADGDTFLLVNGGIYNEYDPIVIDKDITLRAQTDVELPALDASKMPLINNEHSTTNMFNLTDGGYLRLIGVDVDGGGSATKIIVGSGLNAVIEGLFVNRCRLHNCSGDIMGILTKKDSTVLKLATIMNSFIYESGAHGIYIKDFYAEDGVDAGPYVMKDLTFWNLGQQFLWVQMQTIAEADVTTKSTFVLDHLTGWNLSTSMDKELFGNSDGGGLLDITFTNSIVSDQVTPTEQNSLVFCTYNKVAETQSNVVTLRNLVLYNVESDTVRPGSDAIEIDNKLTDDPAFTDAAGGNFTLGNAAYVTAGDDGSAVGARYWVPGFVDDFSDLQGGSSISSPKANDIAAEVYPIPFSNEINFAVNFENSTEVTISIVDISGRTIKANTYSMTSGSNQVTIEANDILPGSYFYTISTKDAYTSGRLIKVQ